MHTRILLTLNANGSEIKGAAYGGERERLEILGAVLNTDDGDARVTFEEDLDLRRDAVDDVFPWCRRVGAVTDDPPGLAIGVVEGHRADPSHSPVEHARSRRPALVGLRSIARRTLGSLGERLAHPHGEAIEADADGVKGRYTGDGERSSCSREHGKNSQAMSER